ncbi:LysM peptidoglycan-binding domain-containing protein [Mesonia sp. MT50]|uniref:LysM peptidoglycan-binding domain-containing protein n=1 Tax=Mesonia profundi TaxID=3070998 RepID=A0ABU0ZYN7_9FLAO|nr:LysM peptidoglycan-binding domain-containing protein [Mesonia profundi]MDQ7916527.1 LysM peptidoglycan-binding domain-containing protein [Mesonia profundi]
MNKVLAVAFLLTSFVGFAQENPESETKDSNLNKQADVEDSLKQLVKRSVPGFSSVQNMPSIQKDSIKVFLGDYQPAREVDSLWKVELLNSDLYETMNESVMVAADLDSVNYKVVSTDTLKARLARINAKTPFNVEYNPSLESVINYYIKRRKESVERLLSLSQYYFPLFEEKLDQYDIPLEMKYLAIVESALNPRAKSRVGATGLWQFMFATGKMHGLDVSSYVDERMDPVLATEAACKYLSNLYKTFGDWDLALASYNSGPGNVAKAIRRSGGNTNYWELRNYLPRETAGYVPAFIATMYLFEYAEEHGFKPYRPEITYFETDTIKVKKLIKFDQIATVTGVDKELLSFLNPSYKIDIIPYQEDEEYYIRLPLREAGVFVSNENLIYNFVDEQIANEKEEKGLPTYVNADDKIRYKVRSGDYLGKIATKYGVGISSLKRWNGLRSNRLKIGQRLTIYPRKPVATANVSNSSKGKSSSMKTYTVKQGDSLWSISQKFSGVSVKNIQKWNGISGSRLKPGMKLKVSNG